MGTRLEEAKLKDEILRKVKENPKTHFEIDRFIKKKFPEKEYITLKKLIDEIINDGYIDRTKVASSQTVKYNPKADDFLKAGDYEQEYLEGLTLAEKRTKQVKKEGKRKKKEDSIMTGNLYYVWGRNILIVLIVIFLMLNLFFHWVKWSEILEFFK